MSFSLRKSNKGIDKATLIGRQANLVHDITIYQHGTIFIDDVRYCVKTVDGSELSTYGDTMVEVVGVDDFALSVKKVA